MEATATTATTSTEHGRKHIHYDLIDDGTIDYYPGFLSKEEADELFELCKYEEGVTNPNVPWSQDQVS